MYFSELIWHTILEFRHGERPFGFWDWKSSVHNVLKQLENEYYPCYYWASHQRHCYDTSGMLDYTIYTISTYGQSNWITEAKPIKYTIKDKKYCDEFTEHYVGGTDDNRIFINYLIS